MGDPFFRYNCSDFLTRAAAAAARKNAVMSYHISVCWTNHIHCHFEMAHLESFQINISPFHRIWQRVRVRVCLFYSQPIKWFHISSLRKKIASWYRARAWLVSRRDQKCQSWQRNCLFHLANISRTETAGNSPFSSFNQAKRISFPSKS